jgi:hypothetical protein
MLRTREKVYVHWNAYRDMRHRSTNTRERIRVRKAMRTVEMWHMKRWNSVVDNNHSRWEMD